MGEDSPLRGGERVFITVAPNTKNTKYTKLSKKLEIIILLNENSE